MGAQVQQQAQRQCSHPIHLSGFKLTKVVNMKAMKAMKAGGKVMTKGALADALATESGLKKSECTKVVNGFGGIATQQLKSVGKFVVPGLCMIKTRLKPATKAGKREIFGKVTVVKAKPARTVVKAFPVSAIKKAF